MSLINKMLQDLDSRGTVAGEGMPTQVRAVARAPHKPRWPVLAGAAGVAAVAIAAGGYVVVHTRAVAPAPAAAAARLAPSAGSPPTGMRSTVSVTPPVATADTPVAPLAAAVPAPTPDAGAAPAPVHDRFDAPAAPAAAPVARAAAAPAAPAPAPVRAAPAPITAEPMDPDSDEARAARAAIAQVLAARAGTPLPRDAHARAPAAMREEDAAARTRRGVPGRQETGAQRAETEYRRALASLQDGRTNDTVDALEQALKYDPAHEAARQTLVGLLIETKRTEEAMRQLQLGLTQDIRQPALAMLLARLQIERGASGIETLQRTLPYAGNDADYHAFMAAALARQGRQREAAEQYQQAVRTAPSNGVWWMGLGMSLEADKRNAEALDAFQKGRASGTLSPELQAFVERRIQQLGR